MERHVSLVNELDCCLGSEAAYPMDSTGSENGFNAEWYTLADSEEKHMHIWVDADACPGVIKDILYRAAKRTGIALTLVANKLLRVPASPHIRAVQVPAGFDVADEKIAGEMRAGDIVVTGDIPLAAQVIARGGTALDPRGTLYTRENIEEALTMRNFMDHLRSSGVQTGGPAPHTQGDRHAFAKELDRLLAGCSGRQE